VAATPDGHRLKHFFFFPANLATELASNTVSDMTRNDCKYCDRNGHELRSIMAHIADLPVSAVYLFNDQTYYGRCVVSYAEHRNELFELDRHQLAAYMADIARVAGAVSRVTGCAKVNYAVYGDQVGHLHFHIVPKSPGGPNWGEAFVLAPLVPRRLEPGDFAALLERLRRELASPSCPSIPDHK
jgi:diadenosine tetraphosphate (Ap4A) HIT family hydrolase